MEEYSRLQRFPLGSVLAEGFLKEQMEIGKDGICGQLHKLEPAMIMSPFIKKEYVKAWGPIVQSAWGGEISGNYWTGYIQFAYTLNDPEMIKTATDWVDRMMKNQREDGYLGTYTEEGANMLEDFNAWGTACAMRGLVAFYEATGREDVINAVYRCMLWFCENWSGNKKTFYSGPAIIEVMIWVYRYIKDKRLVEFCVDYAEFMCTDKLIRTSYKAMLEDELHYFSNHTAGLGVALRLPALVYSVTGEEKYLNASKRKINQILEKCTHLSGGPVCVSEYLAPVGASCETEYCSFTFYNATYSAMSCITGESVWGDLMEEIFYNGAQGARKKDEKAIAYFTSPNQICASDTSSPSMGDKQLYCPCYPTSCCPVNAVAIVPEFIRGMLLGDKDDNVYVMAYGPCSLNYKDISLRLNTLYPFRNSAKIEINCNKAFSVNLKVPKWSKGFNVKVNEKTENITLDNNGFIKIERAWEKGDVIEISFEAKPEVIHVDDSDYAKKYPLAIKYGALLFSYHIPEIWTPIKGYPETPLPEGWNWYNVTPYYEQADDEDINNRLALRREQFTWNVALDENLKSEDITVEQIDENGYVWSNPIIKLHTHCYKAPYSHPIHTVKVFEPFCDYQYVTKKIPLVLEPYGCTNLRITYFPKAKLDK